MNALNAFKSCLKKTLGRAYTTFEELQTILCDVEIAINNRPLAYLSEDDLDEPLTPFHLIYGHGYAKGRLNGRTVNVVPGCDVMWKSVRIAFCTCRRY